MCDKKKEHSLKVNVCYAMCLEFSGGPDIMKKSTPEWSEHCAFKIKQHPIPRSTPHYPHSDQEVCFSSVFCLRTCNNRLIIGELHWRCERTTVEFVQQLAGKVWNTCTRYKVANNVFWMEASAVRATVKFGKGAQAGVVGYLIWRYNQTVSCCEQSQLAHRGEDGAYSRYYPFRSRPRYNCFRGIADTLREYYNFGLGSPRQNTAWQCSLSADWTGQ